MTDQLSQNISGNSFSVPGKNMPKDDALTQSSLLLDVSKHQDSFEIPVIIGKLIIRVFGRLNHFIFQ